MTRPRPSRALRVVLLAGALALFSLVPAGPASAAYPTCTYYRVWYEANVPDVGSTGSVDCVMGQGAQSTAVLYLQYTLNYCYFEHLQQDGQFGPLTRDALIRAQRKAGTYPDGVYGPLTRKAILHRAIGPIFGCKRVP
jgi:hypothetical protein